MFYKYIDKYYPISGGKIALEDKLAMMEQIWEDLRINAEENSFIPAWHMDILNNREKNLREGTSSFEDFDTVKKRLRKILNED